MTDYDSRRTGNGLLDTGSTPVWSTRRGSRRTIVQTYRFNNETEAWYHELPFYYFLERK